MNDECSEARKVDDAGDLVGGRAADGIWEVILVSTRLTPWGQRSASG
jgi:hypothetical protein